MIFEDTDGDGKFDKKTVFMEGLNLVSGIEVGFGGVWVGAAPYLLFIPHDEKTDKPAGEPKILLDGWHYEDTHETLNAFIWGPDGWLYGCHGVFTHSDRRQAGRPGREAADRSTPASGATTRRSTSSRSSPTARRNPWGLDYNANGDFFIEACVIPHMWHIIQGGRYHRQAGTHFNPYTYDDIKTIAVHRHYVGANPHGGNNRSDTAGGGHAHCGLMCYQGGTWPKEYHGKLFMGNLHGHRINVDVITPKGSGYVADRNPDFLLTNDKWSIPLAIKYGPDGNVYLLDWYDKQICHLPQPEKWDRTNGRIYKISHKDAKPVTGRRPVEGDVGGAGEVPGAPERLVRPDGAADHAGAVRAPQANARRSASGLRRRPGRTREDGNRTTRTRRSVSGRCGRCTLTGGIPEAEIAGLTQGRRPNNCGRGPRDWCWRPDPRRGSAMQRSPIWQPPAPWCGAKSRRTLDPPRRCAADDDSTRDRRAR